LRPYKIVRIRYFERVIGFEPTNGSLGSYCLTTWLHPRIVAYLKKEGLTLYTWLIFTSAGYYLSQDLVALKALTRGNIEQNEYLKLYLWFICSFPNSTPATWPGSLRHSDHPASRRRRTLPGPACGAPFAARLGADYTTRLACCHL
jgi:hypothetical protein